MSETQTTQPNEQELVLLGEDAEKLLKNETFTKTINAMVEGTFNGFVNTSPDDSGARERIYAHYRALADIIHTLQQQVNIRDEIIKKNQDSDSDNNSEDE